MNYTYEKRTCTKSVTVTWTFGFMDKQATYKAWVILDKNGRKIAEDTSEKQANLIVVSLNGAV